MLITINEAPTEAEIEADIAEAVGELGIVEDQPEGEGGEDGEDGEGSESGDSAESASSEG